MYVAVLAQPGGGRARVRARARARVKARVRAKVRVRARARNLTWWWQGVGRLTDHVHDLEPSCRSKGRVKVRLRDLEP